MTNNIDKKIAGNLGWVKLCFTSLEKCESECVTYPNCPQYKKLKYDGARN